MRESCEVCGDIATCVTRDIAEVTKWDAVWKEFEKFGTPHYYCSKHVRPPDQLDLRCGPTNEEIKKMTERMVTRKEK